MAQISQTIGAAHGVPRDLSEFMVRVEDENAQAQFGSQFIAALPGGAEFLESLKRGSDQKP